MRIIYPRKVKRLKPRVFPVKTEDALKKWGRLLKDVPLKGYTSFKIGGRASYLFLPFNEECLVSSLRFLKKEGLGFRILGGGSNLLISSRGLEEVIIKLSFPEFKKIEIKDTFLYVGAGVLTKELLSFCIKRGIGGFEFLGGLPASLGGLLITNASFLKKDMGEVTEKVRVLKADTLREVCLERKDINFSYRMSSLKGSFILGAFLRYELLKPDLIKEMINENLRYRFSVQDYFSYSAGSVFKNPDFQSSAASLIEACGLKGLRHNRAKISSRHANFIINESGNCDSSDVVYLIEYIKERVYSRFGILLEEEIERWGC